MWSHTEMELVTRHTITGRNGAPGPPLGNGPPLTNSRPGHTFPTKTGRASELGGEREEDVWAQMVGFKTLLRCGGKKEGRKEEGVEQCPVGRAKILEAVL